MAIGASTGVLYCYDFCIHNYARFANVRYADLEVVASGAGEGYGPYEWDGCIGDGTEGS